MPDDRPRPRRILWQGQQGQCVEHGHDPLEHQSGTEERFEGGGVIPYRLVSVALEEARRTGEIVAHAAIAGRRLPMRNTSRE